jgi:hypothetical protein
MTERKRPRITIELVAALLANVVVWVVIIKMMERFF